MNKNVYSVSQINTYIERMFSDDFMLGNLSLSGEVSNCKYNHTGHIYFTLKDDKSSISCVMFAGKRAKGLKFNMKDGDQIVVTGYVGIYAAAGRYQVYANEIELAGVGDLYQRFEALKQELEESGMFDAMYKKPLPSHAMRIGIITAPTGAAVHDIIRVSKTRNPFVELILYPAQVQGEGAVPSIISGINCLDELNLDVIILGRGGGSIEDLWAFNEEPVARAIFKANTPIISAVGHETDFTIADFVADKRAATPSQAAELANFVYEDFARTVERYSDRLNSTLDYKLSSITSQLENYKLRLQSLRPENKIKANQDKLNHLYDRLNSLMNAKIERYESRLIAASGRLDGLSPAKRLASGFGYVTGPDGKKVDSVSNLSVGDSLSIRVKDGMLESQITSISKDK
ncbi:MULTISPECIES: exodeoxyribonuclease VII large subunit [Pseudobutyrivibrio]|uniref:Exodeoxyribonuclease 7 large subunit n=1 Tax=Pseudobutyrivibrio ruminis DSM 9787 TaxID=1123011 RepID=A0A285REC5_9FIRM|nr:MULTISPECIES: exodeoxyribonuclease VII large subunit [Pseudobutyrivibrio]SFN94233.1 Exodeoxyribonuclease VII large subunit [Pseudobutyrivibrio sp. JW11]SOB92244.1 Exodeoxyribonuclease VII large subunit [Pseudobutyrivibrio ruminis DSM 9787]